MTAACTWFSMMVMLAGWFSTTYTTSGLSKIIGAFLKYGPREVKGMLQENKAKLVLKVEMMSFKVDYKISGSISLLNTLDTSVQQLD